MSLLEALLGMTVTLLLLLGALGLLSAQSSAQRRAARAAEAEENLRLSLAALQAELRGAGDGYPGAEIVALAQPSRLTLNNAAEGARLATTFWLDAGTLRRRRGTSTQPMVDGIDGFELEYLDDGEPPQPVPVDTAEQRQAIRQIRLTLRHNQPPRSLRATVLLRRPLP
jgi:hypothetical protein